MTNETTITITETEYHEHCESYDGLCLNPECGAIRYGSTEPDAENYPCEDCGGNTVRGFENALICGNVNIE